MRVSSDFQTNSGPAKSIEPEMEQATVDRLFTQLDRDGVVVLPDLLTRDQLINMQRVFELRLQRMRWNNFEGYQKTEPYRHMIEDVLLLEQGFVDLALHPLVTRILTRYLGDRFELTEAKGWLSLPTKRDFHGWHGDAWYDQTGTEHIPREVKLAVYLTDVRSGAFNYIKGTHRKQHPHLVPNSEVSRFDRSQIAELTGKAGSAFLFDTSGIHRQGVPMLDPRQAIFYNYHDPDVPLQKEDLDYYRYHPLLLNAAFLGGLTEESQRILGFGNKTNLNSFFQRNGEPPFFIRPLELAFTTQLRLKILRTRVLTRL